MNLQPVLSKYSGYSLLLLILMNCMLPLAGQDTKIITPAPFPAAYTSLASDTARMRFLANALNDSLNEDRLSSVYGWARTGLAMAEKNNIDTMKGIFNFYIAKAYTYKLVMPESAVVYYKKVLPYFPDKLRKYNVFSVRELMERYSEMGNMDSTFVYLNSLKALIDTMPVTSPKRVSLSQNIATVYQWFGMFKTAISYYNTAINGERKNGNTRGLGLALANLGELYDESEDDEKAIRYSKEALLYLEDVNMPYFKTASNIASFYCNRGGYDSALVYIGKSNAVVQKTGDTQQEVYNRMVMGDILVGQKKYDHAKPLIESVIKDVSPSDTWTLAKAHVSLASLDTCMHNYTSAKEHFLQALQLSKDNKQEVLVVIALQGLAAACSKLKDFENGFRYQQEYIQRKDSMTNAKTKATMADLEIAYETQQKEEQIALLKKDNDIAKLELQSNRRSAIFYSVAFIMAIIIAGILFYQRNLRNKLETRRLKAELETKVLRLQMNPHFIFNSLNSIENFIMRNEKRQASDYLNKFARLIRMILDSSRTEVVPVSKDMEALQLYIDLEQLRFNNKFSYKTHIDQALLGGDYLAPSLLIQPYVENAIVHGLANSNENDLSLTVTATLENNTIKYTVLDNGIGREKSAEYNRQNKPAHESVGLKITEDRIRLFNNNRRDTVTITDLYDEHAVADGTKVEIIINAM